jgi:molecular chaperone GrpE
MSAHPLRRQDGMESRKKGKHAHDQSHVAAPEETPDPAPGPEEPLPVAQGEPHDVPVSTADTFSPAGASDVRRQLEEQRDKFLRLAAEYDNYRKRTLKERAEAGARAQSEIVRYFIDAIDDLARFAHVDPATVDAATVVHGVELVEKKLLKALGEAGLQVVNPVDAPFDPAAHEAVMTEPALSPEDDHMVGRVFQVGYLFNGQLLRPARVVVKQWNG